jgi:hypothetical protein
VELIPLYELNGPTPRGYSGAVSKPGGCTAVLVGQATQRNHLAMNLEQLIFRQSWCIAELPCDPAFGIGPAVAVHRVEACR